MPLLFTASAVGMLKRAFVPTALVIPDEPTAPAKTVTLPVGEMDRTTCAFVSATSTVTPSAATATPCGLLKPTASVEKFHCAMTSPMLGVARAETDREGVTVTDTERVALPDRLGDALLVVVPERVRDTVGDAEGDAVRVALPDRLAAVLPERDAVTDVVPLGLTEAVE